MALSLHARAWLPRGRTIEFAAIDLRPAEGTGARCVFLQRSSAARTMQRRCLLWRGRKHVALSFQFPALTHVVTHLAARVAFARRKLCVVGLEFDADADRRTCQAAHVRNLHRSHDDSLYCFQV